MKLSNITKIFVVVAVFAMLMAACAPKAEAPVAEAPAAEAPAAEAPAAEAPAAEAAFGQADCAPNCTYADMVMCYPQLGAESDWRTANTASFKSEAEKLGFQLVFSDAQQKQENQISPCAPASSKVWMSSLCPL